MADVLEAAATWLEDRAIAQWPRQFLPELLLGAVAAGQTWLVRERGSVVATITVGHADPVWSDHPAPASYVHRMAVKRHGEGIGLWMLDWVERRARSAGCHFVRLDCVASNAELCGYYERLGFHSRGTVEVGGSPGERRNDQKAPPTLVRRFERPVRTYAVGDQLGGNGM